MSWRRKKKVGRTKRRRVSTTSRASNILSLASSCILLAEKPEVKDELCVSCTKQRRNCSSDRILGIIATQPATTNLLRVNLTYSHDIAFHEPAGMTQTYLFSLGTSTDRPAHTMQPQHRYPRIEMLRDTGVKA